MTVNVHLYRPVELTGWDPGVDSSGELEVEGVE
jgi:hypothetical protein